MSLDLEKIKPITGLHIHYYFLCKRKLWFYAHRMSLEDSSEDVKIGRILHEVFYPREAKNIFVGDISIDILDLNSGTIVVEIKKSGSKMEPILYQLYYYLYVIERSGVKARGLLKIPNEKRVLEVELTEDVKTKLEAAIRDILEIINLEKPPPPVWKNTCKKCAYKDFCFI